MGLRYPDQKHASWFFVTTTFKDRQRLGDIPRFYERLCESLAFSTKKYHAAIAGYVLMPNHIHLVIGIDGNLLGGYMRDFKKFVTQKVAKDFGLAGSIWMPRYDRVAIGSKAVMRTKLNYIHDNPVRAGLVSRPEDWFWSSAADYLCDRVGPLPVFKNWT